MRLPIALFALLILSAPAVVHAETLHFTASLDGAQETPPKPVAATGQAAVDLDTMGKTISWKITYSGLTGPATMAHFHGPAAQGASANVQVPITGNLSSPMKGSAAISDVQIGDLRAGEWYVNIHTAKYPGGEIRGQLTAAP